jgi:hypothetical protein
LACLLREGEWCDQERKDGWFQQFSAPLQIASHGKFLPIVLSDAPVWSVCLSYADRRASAA